MKITMPSASKFKAKLRARKQQLKTAFALFCAAALIGGVTASVAQVDQATTGAPSSTQECKVFNSAVSTAMQNHMSLVDRFMSSAQKGMDKAMNNSCLSAIQMLNFNMSSLIPDFNIFGKILEIAMEKFTQYLTSQVCQAVNSVIGDWNNVVGQLTTGWSVNSQIERWGNDVVMHVPGGNNPMLSPSVGGGAIELIPANAVGGGNGSSNCTTTLSGIVCTDGTVKPVDNGSNSSGGSNGSDYAGNSVNGGQVGAEYERMKLSCTQSQSTWNNAVQGGYQSLSAIENLRLEAVNTCKIAQSYYSQYTSYLASSGGVSIHQNLNTPTSQNPDLVGNVNSGMSGASGLPIRQ